MNPSDTQSTLTRKKTTTKTTNDNLRYRTTTTLWTYYVFVGVSKSEQ